MRTSLGTYAWTEQTGGKLALRDRFSLLIQGIRARAQRARQLKSGIKVRHIEVEDIVPPDSSLCNAAVELCREVSGDYLFNHCLRSYFWARLLNGGQSFDDEATFTAFMLHDLGLTERYRLNGNGEHCFTLPAARVAEEMASAHGWSDRRAALVADAITLHLNVIVDDCHGREAQLVRLGSGVDVAGLNLELLHQDQIDSVVTIYPRQNLKQHIMRDLDIEVQQRPCCRISFLCRKLDFARYVERSRFSE